MALSISSNASLMFESWCVADFAKMISLGVVSTIVMFVLALQQECCNTASVWVKKSPSEGKVGTYNQTISIHNVNEPKDKLTVIKRERERLSEELSSPGPSPRVSPCPHRPPS